MAQCLHPSFPAGVHMKALETYDAIFEMLGAEGLLGDLGTFSSGIFPFVQHAATHVTDAPGAQRGMLEFCSLAPMEVPAQSFSQFCVPNT